MKRTFADFEDKAKLACFSDKNDKRPEEITYASGVKRLFECDKCPHSFMKSIDVVTLKGVWCPYCANQALCGDRDCKTCFEKSYEHHAGDLAKYWSPKNIKKPHEVLKGSGTKYYHHCVKCSHDFLMRPNCILGYKKYWCNFCANRARCPKSDNCSTCFEKTFASFDKEKVSCWSARNDGVPYDFARASHHYAYFDCRDCSKSFRMRIDKVTCRLQWCPKCSLKASKNVVAISKALNKVANVNYKPEVSVKCEDRNLRWDFAVKNGGKVFYIENDGEQHFSVAKTMQLKRDWDAEAGWEHFVDQRRKDLLKDEHIRKTNGLLFRVSYMQLSIISQLVQEMIEQSNSGKTGVVYMDETAYKDWGPLE